MSRSEIAWLIEEYCFVARDREILKSRWLDGLTFEEIATKHDISERQAKNIIRKNRERVLTHVDRLKLH
jgi:DNA-directed RNA polymerase specialized sigma24 family protein